MKKIISLVVAALISVTASFAERTFHLGAYFPFSSGSYDDGGDIDFKTRGVGFYFDSTRVADSGFTVKPYFGIGGMGTRQDDFKNSLGLEKIGGVDLDLGVGLGGSPIHNDRMTLSILGDLGVRAQIGSETESYSGIDVDFTFLDVLFYVGPEIAYTIRFNEHVGLFANVGVFFNIGLAGFEVELLGASGDTSGFAGVFTVLPRVGLSFTI